MIHIENLLFSKMPRKIIGVQRRDLVLKEKSSNNSKNSQGKIMIHLENLLLRKYQVES